MGLNMNINKKLYIKKTRLKIYLKQCCLTVWSVRKTPENKDPKVVATKNERMMLSSNFVVCRSNKSSFIKEQEAKRLLSSLGTKISFTNKISITG